MGTDAHDGLLEIGKSRVAQRLGEEVADVAVRAQEVHAQLALTDVIADPRFFAGSEVSVSADPTFELGSVWIRWIRLLVCDVIPFSER